MSGEARLVAVAREELAGIMGVNADPVRAITRAWAGGLHQYTLGHLERMRDVESALSAHPALRVAGAAFDGIGLNECVMSGRNAADAVLLALSDRAALRSPDQLVSGGAN